MKLWSFLTLAVVNTNQEALAQHHGTRGSASRLLDESYLIEQNSARGGYHGGGRRTRRELDTIIATGEWMYFVFGETGSDIDTFPFGPRPPFTFDGRARLDVTDDFLKGDRFEVLDNDAPIGKTSFVPVSDGRIDDLDEAFADPTVSSGSFYLGKGSHSIRIIVTKSPYGGGGGFYRLVSCDVSAKFLDTTDPGNPLQLVDDKLNLCFSDKPSLTIEAVAPCANSVTLKLFDEKSGSRILANTESVRPFTLGNDIDATGELFPVAALKKPGKYRIEISQRGQPTYDQSFEVGYWC